MLLFWHHFMIQTMIYVINLIKNYILPIFYLTTLPPHQPPWYIAACLAIYLTTMSPYYRSDATKRAHQHDVNIYYVCQAHTLATKRINMMCEYILCMSSTYACKRMYVWIYIMHVKHICALANASTWCVNKCIMPNTYACKCINIMCEYILCHAHMLANI